MSMTKYRFFIDPIGGHYLIDADHKLLASILFLVPIVNQIFIVAIGLRRPFVKDPLGVMGSSAQRTSASTDKRYH
jgi:hypothetical protein